MINWMYFPENKEIETHLKKVVDVFTLSSTGNRL